MTRTASGASGASHGGSRLAGAGLLALVLAAAAALALLASACGGSSPEGVAQAETTETTTTTSDPPDGPRTGALVAYATCMRKNGVPKFPDPDPGQGFGIHRPGARPQFVPVQGRKCGL
jgi:hypothetical protein